MGKSQKKTAKGRLDKWYKLAKEQGYRSRAAFKLVQLNKKYGFLEKSKVVIDLCAAPGGWLQVAQRSCKPGSIIVGVDLVPIKPIPGCETFVQDITSDKCRSQLNGYLKGWKADAVLHDGAPNVGTAWLQDAYSQAELVLQSLKLATEFLVPGGTFATKVFRSKDYNNLMWVFNQLFNKVEATKPQSSRNVSAEIFVVCRGFKAPQKLDPKFVDPKAVFEDLLEPTTNVDAKVFHPEKKKRQREGYAEGDYTLHSKLSVSEFVKSSDPIRVLGTTSELVFEPQSPEDMNLKKLPVTTSEIKICCQDLRVLGKRDFRGLLKWRLSCRDHLGIGQKKDDRKGKGDEEHTENVDIIDEDEAIDKDIEQARAIELSKSKRERRRANEQKQRAIRRMQMGMMTPHDIGNEQGDLGDEAPFGLADMEKAKRSGRLDDSMQVYDSDSEEEDHDQQLEEEDDASDSELASARRLDLELDDMYNQYQDRRASSNAKLRAKKARNDIDSQEWHGITESGSEEDESGEASGDSDTDSLVSDGEGRPQDESLVVSLNNDSRPQGQLSKKAALFFDQDLFRGIEEEAPEGAAKTSGNVRHNGKELDTVSPPQETPSLEEDNSESENGIEVVPRDDSDGHDFEDESDDEKAAKSNVDIATAEAMTIAQQLAGKKKKHSDVVDDGYNRWSYQPMEGVPEWFMDDQKRHNKPSKPITKEAAEAIQEKMRALNARPIKKVMEAQGRKKHRAMKKLQNMQKKAESINESSDLTEREKAQNIQRMMARATKSKPKQETKVVVAKGANRGIKSRPKGVKGKYKMVDRRMKKETRAQKRIQKGRE